MIIQTHWIGTALSCKCNATCKVPLGIRFKIKQTRGSVILCESCALKLLLNLATVMNLEVDYEDYTNNPCPVSGISCPKL